ncbi:MAG: aldo/keto reductase [Oscillospiraceae bacterium]|jgi:L-glyceraldehyde 3-phosphate reductase|nr:aldo/keto reductase [Oscillospiraceae bacterium]
MELKSYAAAQDRYGAMPYRRCGKSGLKLSALSLGMWQNFGDRSSYETCRAVARRAFDLGITVFDLANNYGPPIGAAEKMFGRLMRDDFLPYRDEMIVTTKAGFPNIPGPYGDGGSRKYLLASLDRSLRNMGLDYVDIFYHHRADPETPLEETMGALAGAVKSGKALYAGISNYTPEQAEQAAKILRGMGVPLLICQSRYNMLERGVEEEGMFRTAERCGFGMTAYSPLSQGRLTGKYNSGIPAGSRASRRQTSLSKDTISPEMIGKVQKIGKIARRRGQTPAQLALSWILREPAMASVIVGVSSTAQLEENIAAVRNLSFEDEELAEIEQILK